MSVYVGIDVHRRRSQVAVVTEDGAVQLNKNTVNGTEPTLRLIGNRPAGTPVAFEAAFGWSWLAELLEDYGFEAHLVHPLRCKAIASARLKNDKGRCRDLGAAAAGRPAPEAWIAKRRGTKIATISISRNLLTRAWHLLSQLEPADATSAMLTCGTRWRHTTSAPDRDQSAPPAVARTHAHTGHPPDRTVLFMRSRWEARCARTPRGTSPCDVQRLPAGCARLESECGR